MFKFLTDSVENALDVVFSPFDLDGELPTKRQVAKLIADGLTVAAVAHGLGVAEDVITGILEGNDG